MKLDVKFSENAQNFGVGFGEVQTLSVDGSPYAVLFTEQKLSESQMAQARENIGAQESGDYLLEKALDDAIDEALAQAKASGEFDGRDGEKGDKGADGKDGYTPVKGKDYFTESDKMEMVNAVISALPVYNGEVESV